jgi:threonylcarbamoyladenosine tRNA methylthiotransferase MtaB
MKRASLHTLGCRLNQAETALVESRLRRNGYEVVEFGTPTDLLVINTCSVTEEAERTCRYVIRKTLRHSPEAFIAVTGCYAQTGLHELRTVSGIDLIVGNQFKSDLPDLLPSPEELSKRSRADVVHSAMIDRKDFSQAEYADPASTRAPVKIQDGCNVMCSFCVIPFARGRERSRVLEDALKEAEFLVARGRREIVLTGVNVGQYRHNGRDLVELICALEQLPGLSRIRISSIEPTTVTNELLAHMASSTKLCPYLHIPIQSGDDRVLSAMHRPYRVKDYVALVDRACAAVPGLGLGTDLMVGFPGETEDAFDRTLRLAEALPFSYVHVFPYSPRPGTAAVKLQGDVSVSAARSRAKLLSELSGRKRIAFTEHYIGRTLPVLFEDGVVEGYRMGTTPNYLRVGVPAAAVDANQEQVVRICGASDRWAVGMIAPSHVSAPRKVLLA